MKHPTRPFSPHRFARLVRWAQAILAWLALALYSNTARVDRRRIHQRYRFAALDKFERLIAALVIIRTCEITGIRKRPRQPLPNGAPPGFRRRTKRATMRATLGARLRKALEHRDARQRLQRLIAAFADIDTFARRYLVPRALRRLTKLHAVVPIAPASEAVRALAAPAPCAADTS